MPLTEDLSSLIKDVEKPFWNGNGKLDFKGELARLLTTQPNMTISGLRTALAQQNTSSLESGIGVTLAAPEAITLGEPRGEDDGFSVSVSAELGF